MKHVPLTREDREEGERIAANLVQGMREAVGAEALLLRDLHWLTQWQLQHGRATHKHP